MVVFVPHEEDTFRVNIPVFSNRIKGIWFIYRFFWTMEVYPAPKFHRIASVTDYS